MGGQAKAGHKITGYKKATRGCRGYKERKNMEKIKVIVNEENKGYITLYGQVYELNIERKGRDNGHKNETNK